MRTALMLACAGNHVDVARLLLASGADPNTKDNFGHTAMWEAIKAGRPQMVDMLLEYGGSLGSSTGEVAHHMWVLS